MAPPDALDGPGRDQDPDGGSEGGGHGGEGEYRQPHAQHPPAAEAVAEGGSGQQQHGEGEGVGVDDPLQSLHARMEVGPDLGQGGGDHQVVQADHERRHGGHHVGPQRPVGAGAGRCVHE